MGLIVEAAIFREMGAAKYIEVIHRIAEFNTFSDLPEELQKLIEIAESQVEEMA